MTGRVLLKTELDGLPVYRRGKVRDVYEVGKDLLIISTDRVSAFDVVLDTPIPDKGRILNQLSLFWFDSTRHLIPNHVLTADVDRYPEVLLPYREILAERSMLVRRTEPVPIECVVRGYLYGSGWTEYQRTGAVCGIPLHTGLREAEKLAEPLFTPSTKEESGHDVNISEAEVGRRVGRDLAEKLRVRSLELYRYGSSVAEAKGILIADTKFEFGLIGQELLVIDELMTPDSSRFWPREGYAPGRTQPSYDKQFVRDYLSSLSWNKEPPGPPLPESVVTGTTERYWQAYRTLTGRTAPGTPRERE